MGAESDERGRGSDQHAIQREERPHRWKRRDRRTGKARAKAAEHSAKNPTFKKVYESQREYASKVVPSKRYMFPPYSFAANYYWPQQEKPAAKGGKK